MNFSLFQWLIFVAIDFCWNIVADFPGIGFLAVPLDLNPIGILVPEAAVESALHSSLLVVAQRLKILSSFTRFTKFALTLTVAKFALFAGFYFLFDLYAFLVCQSCEWWSNWQGITLHSIRNFLIGFTFLVVSSLPPFVIAEGVGYLEMQIGPRLKTGTETRYAEYSLRFILAQIAAFVGYMSLWVTFLGQLVLDNPRGYNWTGITLGKTWDIASELLFLTLGNLLLAVISICLGFFTTRTTSQLYQTDAKMLVKEFVLAFCSTEVAVFIVCLCLWAIHVASRFLTYSSRWMGLTSGEMRSIACEATILLAVNLVPILIILVSLQRNRQRAANSG